ncbi:rhomboid family intramembrane serine protease [Myxococcota bacterium]|nr:rhomboid family intramembrane serine protease [Myxococcota bacterium]
MREAARAPHREVAQLFVDYLISRGVEARVAEEDDGYAVWVMDDAHLAQVKREWIVFSDSPNQAKYTQTMGAGARQETVERKEAESARRRHVDMRQQFSKGLIKQVPVSVGLIGISVLVALLTHLGGQLDPVGYWLTIASVEVSGGYIRWAGLADVFSGQVWRLITPIFIHFGILHLVFNMWWMKDLSVLVELRKGKLFLVLFVLIAAVASNLGQYFASGPMFGGMSGVVYALLGYIWMKGRYAPREGMGLHPQTVAFMVGWFLLGVFGIIGHMANWAHGLGLVVGVLIGVAPELWRRFRKST